MRLQGNDVGAIAGARSPERRGELINRGDRLGRTTHRRGVGCEVDIDDLVDAGIGDQVVERHATLVDLQAVDDGEAAVVADDDDQLWPDSTDEYRSEFIIRYEPSPTKVTTSRSGIAIFAPHAPEIS